MESYTNKNTGAHGYREQTVVAWGKGAETGEGVKKVHTSSCEMGYKYSPVISYVHHS